MASKVEWFRDPAIPYPKTWSTFKARDVVGECLVEYEIRDLTQDRFEEAYKHLSTDYIKHEPLNDHLGEFRNSVT